MNGESRLPTLRPEVAAFAVAMEERLRANDHKGGWRDCDPWWLLRRIFDEYRELRVAFVRCNMGQGEREEILREAADVANFCLMVADVSGLLSPERKVEP